VIEREPARMRHHLVGRLLAAGPRLVVGVAVEEVGGKAHAVAERAAQEIAHAQVEGLAHQI
jgi:hypothetical protein